MTNAYVDTNILIRLLTGDDVDKQARAASFFARVENGELTLGAPDTVIADAVFVLSSPRLYNLPRDQIRDLLTALLRLAHFKVQNRRPLLRALTIYAASRLDFGDVLLLAVMEQTRAKVLYSFDSGFDRFPQIERRQP